jgi:hypothetical protein
MTYLALNLLLFLNFTSAPSPVQSLDKLNGTYELIGTYKDQQLQEIKKDLCGYADILEIGFLNDSRLIVVETDSFDTTGETNRWVCTINAMNYQPEIHGNACYVDVCKSKNESGIWMFCGEIGFYKMKLTTTADQLFFSFVEQLEFNGYSHPLFEEGKVLVYQKISDEPFKP